MIPFHFIHFDFVPGKHFLITIFIISLPLLFLVILAKFQFVFILIIALQYQAQLQLLKDLFLSFVSTLLHYLALLRQVLFLSLSNYELGPDFQQQYCQMSYSVLQYLMRVQGYYHSRLQLGQFHSFLQCDWLVQDSIRYLQLQEIMEFPPLHYQLLLIHHPLLQYRPIDMSLHILHPLFQLFKVLLLHSGQLEQQNILLLVILLVIRALRYSNSKDYKLMMLAQVYILLNVFDSIFQNLFGQQYILIDTVPQANPRHELLFFKQLDHELSYRALAPQILDGRQRSVVKESWNKLLGVVAIQGRFEFDQLDWLHKKSWAWEVFEYWQLVD